MARRKAIPVGRSIPKQLAPVLAVAVHVVCFGCCSCSPFAFLIDAASAPNAAKAAMKAVAPQDEGAYTAPALSQSKSAFFTAPSYLSFLLQTRDMRFNHDSQSAYAGIQEFAHETGTHIKIADRGDWFRHDGKFKKVVTIAGESSRILAAFAKMLTPTRSEDSFVTILLPTRTVNDLLGDHGRKICEMQNKTGAFMAMKGPTVSRWTRLKVNGTNAEVNSVVSCLLDEQDDSYIEDTRSILGSNRIPGMDSQTEISLKLDEEQSKFLMGKGGRKVVEISREFRVFLKLDWDSSTWKISGAVGDVYAAHQCITTHVLPDSLSAHVTGNSQAAH
eukprot:TRINITY_DN32572_c0_g1_i1.p1 TRINITY_DN32572_c0_g1~~TRINITY_DN32572_c0_g1_i1.p1  ORF type:complete len:332 (+),score=37.50 TRINITY_DN32572_c0_g1_i1:34-1029(+)